MQRKWSFSAPLAAGDHRARRARYVVIPAQNARPARPPDIKASAKPGCQRLRGFLDEAVAHLAEVFDLSITSPGARCPAAAPRPPQKAAPPCGWRRCDDVDHFL